MVILLLACHQPEPVDVRFVRGGIVRAAKFETRDWKPGDTIDGHVAPKVPECVPLFSVELEDVRRLAAVGAPEPGAALAFSPDGKWLAIGSDAGSLRIVDATTGVERAKRTLAEGAVKRVAWSADGGTLYFGEQSPDANVYAVDPATLKDRWRFRLADEIGTSALPPADDVYGLYSLPAAYAIDVLSDGSILVAGAHGWTADGVRQNRSRLYRLNPDGTVRGAWPATVADAVLLHPAVSGSTVLVPVSRSAAGPAPAELPVGGVALVDLDTMTTRWTQTFPVLAPYFNAVFMWDAVGLDAQTAFVGLGDGRVFLLGDGAVRATLSPGVPVLSAGVPIAAGVGFGALAEGDVYFATTETNIPYGSADPATRPPTAHPAQFTVHAVGPDGTPRWTRPLLQHTAGIVPSPDSRALLVGAGPRTSDERTDLFGAVVLDRTSGEPIVTCPTEGPAYFRPVWAPDSLGLAVSEAPFKVGDAVRGAYRVTVFR